MICKKMVIMGIPDKSRWPFFCHCVIFISKNTLGITIEEEELL